MYSPSSVIQICFSDRQISFLNLDASFPDKLFRNQSNLKELMIKGDRVRTLSTPLFANLKSLTSLKLINMDFRPKVTVL
jgi:hypothetical protein